jgi:hypothetical protein
MSVRPGPRTPLNFSEKKYHTPFVLPQHAKRADEVEEYRNAENVWPLHGVSIWFEDHSWKSGGRVGLEWKNSAGTAGPKGPIRLSLSNIRPSIGTENPIPEEMDHREIAVRVPVMNEVQFLFPSEPCKPLKPRSLHVVFLVEKDVRIKRRRTCDYLSHEEIDRQYEICTRSYQKHRNEEEGRIVAFVTEVGPREEMIFGIIGVMEVDVVAKELTSNWMVAELVVHQRLRK